ncbi:MAG: hypothetical protein HFJ12_04085 [Bacilli bacterium]|nr:hypothetical protein [Bacilli bacterium]
MNILVIGNGFDLAHGLPTKYTDFLLFCSVTKRIIKHSEVANQIPQNNKHCTEWLNNDKNISFRKLNLKNIDENYCLLNKIFKFNERDKAVYEKMTNTFIENCFFGENTNQKLVKEIIYLVHNNFWINYFLQSDMHGDENWIDFESEISNVIKSIDDDMRNHVQGIRSLDDKIEDFTNEYLKKKFNEYIGTNRSKNRYLFGTYKATTYRDIRNNLHNDLNKLIRMFEIYLTEYVENIDIKDTLTDIENISAKPYEEHGEKGTLYSKVLSFNYTNIYEKVYLNKHNINVSDNVDYIHGKADIKNNIETNNMVLGIDEFLPKKEGIRILNLLHSKNIIREYIKKQDVSIRNG